MNEVSENPPKIYGLRLPCGRWAWSNDDCCINCEAELADYCEIMDKLQLSLYKDLEALKEEGDE